MCRRSQIVVDFHELALIKLNASRGKVEPGGIGHPANCHDGKRRLGAELLTILGKVHPHAGLCFLKGIDGAEILSHHHARLAEHRRRLGRHRLILSCQYAGACLEKLDSRPKGVEDRSNLHSGSASTDNQH